MNLYLVSFDPSKTNAVALHQVIKSSPNIKDWWHFLGTSYLIATSASLAVIAGEIRTKWPNQRYLIISVNPKAYNGWLPQEAWSWINKYI